jgi:hypothetical protein
MTKKEWHKAVERSVDEFVGALSRRRALRDKVVTTRIDDDGAYSVRIVDEKKYIAALRAKPPIHP